jgi:ATP-dependent Clp protease ATP-binding subunit ClpC
LTVILFDEIEKAGAAMYKLLLGVLDKGELRLGDAKVVSFRETLIFFTSNLGTRELASRNYTFDKREPEGKQKKGIAENAAKNHFSPEFLNRVDSTITYNHLEVGDVRRILASFSAESNLSFERVDGNGRLKIALSEAAKDWIIERGYSREYGARELRRVWEKEVILPLAEFVTACAGSSRGWGNLRVTVAGDRLEFLPMGLEESLAESLLVAPRRNNVESIFGRVRKAGGKENGPGF